MFLLIKQHVVPFINTSETAKMSSARREKANYQRSRTVGVVKASQPPFTLPCRHHLKLANVENFSKTLDWKTNVLGFFLLPVKLREIRKEDISHASNSTPRILTF